MEDPLILVTSKKLSLANATTGDHVARTKRHQPNLPNRRPHGLDRNWDHFDLVGGKLGLLVRRAHVGFIATARDRSGSLIVVLMQAPAQLAVHVSETEEDRCSIYMAWSS